MLAACWLQPAHGVGRSPRTPMEERTRGKLTKGLVTAAIANKREILYATFAYWLGDHLPGHSIGDLVRTQPTTLA